MEKILVTGVGGNVGQYIGNELMHKGHEVIGIYHNTAPQNADYEMVMADLSSKLPKLYGVNTIVHIAAGLEGTTRRLIRDNIKATENLIDFAEWANVKRMIYMSTVSVYGAVEGELSENSDIVNPEGYGMTKYLSECVIKESAIPEKLIIQLPRMLGPFVNLANTGGSGFLTMTKKILQGEDIVCYIPQVRYNNYLHVGELGKFLEKVLTGSNLGNRKILLGARERLTMLEILHIMNDEIGSRSRITVEEKGITPKCSVINIEEAEKMGFSPCGAEKMLKKFICEADKKWRY